MVRARFVALAALLAACSSDGSEADPGPDPGGPRERIGVFEVELIAPREAIADQPAVPGRTALLGAVYDGVQPSALAWSMTAAVDDCQLWVPNAPFCATPCGSDAVCVADDTCEPYAGKASVGTVTVRGVATTDGATRFTVDPVAGNYQPVGVTLAYPGVTEGEAVEIEAAGSDFVAGFEVTADGIAPLALDADRYPIAEGEPLSIGWTAAAGPRSEIELLLDISHHGGSKGKIECATADDGELSIDGGLIDGLLELGAAGFPTVIAARVARGESQTARGLIELVVRADAEVAVDVPGVRSCNDADDCEAGETCRPDRTCG